MAVRQPIRSAIRSAAALPGPHAQPVLGNAFNFDVKAVFAHSPLQRVANYERYGDIWRLSIFGNQMVFVRDLEAIREVVTSSSFSTADVVTKPLSYHFPHNVVAAEGEDWARMRKVLGRAMQNYKLQPLVESMVETCGQGFGNSPDGSTVDVHDLCSKITFDAFHKFAYNVDFNAVGGENLDILQHARTFSSGFSKRIRMPLSFLWSLPLAENRRMDAAVEEMKVKGREVIADRRAAMSRGEPAVGVFEHVIEACTKEGEEAKMSEAELVDMVAGLLFAAFDTTSSSAAMSLNHLACNPEVQEELHQSLKGINLAELSPKEMGQLPMLNAVLNESNRLTPAAPSFLRTAVEDVELGGFHVEKGSTIHVDWSSAALKKENWTGPSTSDFAVFNPHRWLDTKPSKLAFLPFGFGPRMCAGRQLATLELQMIIAYAAQNFRLEADSTRPMEYDIKLVFGPKDGAWMAVHRR
mmetsp:Transcript_13395/g.29765  ORF Transcript_13395/g.29765 Transcript_13395/m.29765 type:complete len:468 (-) Transcript_13395:272-1675(-)